MKRALASLLGVLMLGILLTGCSYGAVAPVGPDKVVIAKNNASFFGVGRTIYVCKVTDGGVRDCKEAESP